MKFGKVDDASGIDFTLPPDHEGTMSVIQSAGYNGKPNIYIGCAKWNRQDLKNFYPRGTKDELEYYATQFNSIEMNNSFYRIWPPSQYEKWIGKVGDDFLFFPKLFQGVTHRSRLKSCEEITREYLNGIDHLGDKLGMIFMQMHSNFSPKEENRNRLADYLAFWPKEYPVSLELRHHDWYGDEEIAEWLYDLLEQHQVANIITDTAGRRDLLHMRLTTNTAFVRYVGANHESDYSRVEDWVDRLESWISTGLENVYFFVHQNDEIESVNISRHMITLLNDRLGTNLKIPKTLDTPDTSTPTLF